ncbi:MAG: hypothetical protein ACFB3T_08000 [Geminicoccaceae bacterium]
MSMKHRVHPIAGGVALLTIATFWLSTVVSELFGSVAWIVQVKTLIPWGFIVLISALALTGASGFALARGCKSGLIERKRRRMPLIAGNGLLILIPSALFLAASAKAGVFDTRFYVVQVIELTAGGINFWLLARNALDGRRMTANRRAGRGVAAAPGPAGIGR